MNSDTTKYWQNNEKAKIASEMTALCLDKILEGDVSNTSEGQERRLEVQEIPPPRTETGDKNARTPSPFLGFEKSQCYINVSEETVNKSLAMMSKLNENLEKVLKYFSANDETPTATDNTDVPSTSSANPPRAVPFEMKDASNQSEQEPNHSSSQQINVTINAWSDEKVILQELLRDSGLPLLVSNCSLLTIAENLVAKDENQSKAMNCRPVLENMPLFLLSFQERVRVSFMSLLGKWNRLGLEEKHQFSAALSRFTEIELSNNASTSLKTGEEWLLTLLDSGNEERCRIAPHCETSGVVELTQSPAKQNYTRIYSKSYPKWSMTPGPVNISIETAASSPAAIWSLLSPQENSDTESSSSTNQPMQPIAHDYQWVQPNPGNAQQPPNHEATNHSGNSRFRSYQNASELCNRLSTTAYPTATNPVPCRITKRRSTIHSAGDWNDFSLRPEQQMERIFQGLVGQAQPSPLYSSYDEPIYRFPTQVLNQSNPMNAYLSHYNNWSSIHPIQASFEIPGINHQTNQCNMIGSHQSGQMNVAAPDHAASHNQNQNQYHMDGSQNSGQLQPIPAPSPAPVSFKSKSVDKGRFTAVDPCVSIEPGTDNTVAYHGPNSNHYTMPAMISNASRIPDNIDPNSINVPSRPPRPLRPHNPTSNPSQTAVRYSNSYLYARDPRNIPDQPTAGDMLHQCLFANPLKQPLKFPTNPHQGYPYSSVSCPTAGAVMPIHARRMSVFGMNCTHAQATRATRSPANLVIDEDQDPEHHF